MSRPITSEEVADFRMFRTLGFTLREIAEACERSPEAIRLHLGTFRKDIPSPLTPLLDRYGTALGIAQALRIPRETIRRRLKAEGAQLPRGRRKTA